MSSNYRTDFPLWGIKMKGNAVYAGYYGYGSRTALVRRPRCLPGAGAGQLGDIAAPGRLPPVGGPALRGKARDASQPRAPAVARRPPPPAARTNPGSKRQRASRTFAVSSPW